jgi:anaerobic magnesium-protoporphyrin IX monomethyl ester cyclase
MADILLAHSFFVKNDPKQLERRRPYPPLGTMYAASNLRHRGYAVALFDAMLSDGEHEFEALLDRHHPSIVVFYEDQFNYLNKMCLTHSRDATGRMCQAARSRGATVVAAGSDVTDHPDVYFERGVQFALVGEADHSLCELLGALTGRCSTPLDAIPGLRTPRAAPGSAERRPTPPHPEPERRPDIFPFPAWDLVDIERYRSVWLSAHGYFSINMVSTRGCPFNCNWCAKPIWGQRYAMRSPSNVAEEMALLKQTIAPDHVWFADDIFGLQPSWVTRFAADIEARDGRIPFTIQSRVDLMTQESVAGLVQAGCVEVWLGVESGSQKILNAMDKGTTVPQIIMARRRLGDAGIRACFFLQFGYPGEDLGDILATVQLVRDLLPDDIGISVSYPLPGTRFYEMVRAQLGCKDHWNDSNDLAMMFFGRYRTAFYRQLHDLLHRDLELRQRLRGRREWSPDLRAQLDMLASDWFELGRLEATLRNDAPTRIEKTYHPAASPDLSEAYN